ncbi:YlxQ family RNA-binding protein [Alkalicoccobacillus murimartini]|uniref:Ribosomal protein L7Ae-like RNA K-turn-binding protein n=1 Tax=Alkalicoccobacillus murimartini TaxID=171685 RepID=A0ABT9YEN4_9BACI|nr:YlxQ family RNA-binding protein [Alkalicoccobacillus murimartini]MDQ0206305.1 ribosomal protein L7Ae-like RNA K-turn-binding protein [Alkalicoccobacillus murimartini]
MTSQSEKWLSLLGLAARARELVTGEELVLKDVRKKSVCLVLLAGDASESTAKKVKDKCLYYNIPLQQVADRASLGAAVGKAERVVIGIKSRGFAGKITELLDQ